MEGWILKLWSFLKTLRFSRKSALWALIGVVVAILIYLFGILPLVEAARKAEEEIVLKKKVLLKYREHLQNRHTVQAELDQTLKQYEAIQQRLLPGETAQLGSANLQEIVKRFSEKNGISIRSFRILEPKEMNVYRKISLQIEFSPIPSLLNLSQFIYDIEHHEKELMISELDFLALNPRAPNSLQGSLVISGLMKTNLDKEKGKER
jgi:uncharacterized membrane-anchored protein YhcB (DUF1043 family)